LKSVFEVSSGNPPGCHGFENYIVNKAEGSINTALLNQKLYDLCVSKKVRFLFGVHVLKLNVEQKYAECETIGKIYAQKILLTINGFIPQLLPIKDVNAVRNQVIVTEKIQGLSLKGCYHMDRGYVYFRQVDQRILIGGGRNVLGVSEVTDQLDTTPEAIRFLKNIITKHILIDRIPAIEFHWSGILGVGSDKKPIIQEVHQDIFVGVRMGGMGVAISSIVGKATSRINIRDGMMIHRKCRYILNFLICFMCLMSFNAYSQQKDTVDFVNFEEAKHGVIFSKEKMSIFTGEVAFNHKGVYFYADTVIRNDQMIRAIGNVLIQQGDTLAIFADSLHYNADTRTM
jgi:hypothetical protein